jgi:hypothetical protein
MLDDMMICASIVIYSSPGLSSFPGLPAAWAVYCRMGSLLPHGQSIAAWAVDCRIRKVCSLQPKAQNATQNPKQPNNPKMQNNPFWVTHY